MPPKSKQVKTPTKTQRNVSVKSNSEASDSEKEQPVATSTVQDDQIL